MVPGAVLVTVPVPTMSAPFLSSTVALLTRPTPGPLRNTDGNPVSADCSSDTVPLVTIERESETNKP